MDPSTQAPNQAAAENEQPMPAEPRVGVAPAEGVAQTAESELSASSELPPEPVPDGAVSESELEQLRAEEVAISWQASEYVHHVKSMRWYATLGGLTLLLVVIMALLKFWLAIALFLAMAGAIVVYARKPPRVLTYELTPLGITVEGKPYPYRDFRAFSVLPDAEWHSIELEPSKRLAPPMTVLFEDQDLEAIVSHLELHLPRVEHEPDFIDRFTRYIRF